MSKRLSIDIDNCKDCSYGGFYYTNPSMVYRNRCEHPKAKDVHINDGLGIIPDGCPLDSVPEKDGK